MPFQNHGIGEPSAEVSIIGAGLAGAVLASVLGQAGRKCILIDPRPTFPQLFRAEKIDEGQVHLLRRFGLLSPLLPYAERIREVKVGYDGEVIKTIPIEQYGIAYGDIVNALRARLPESVEMQWGRVNDILTSGDLQRVQLSSGEEIVSRFVVVACGSAYGPMGFRSPARRMIRRNQSIVFGFDIEPTEPEEFNFDSVTYYALNTAAPISYLTLFRFQKTMRANLFVYLGPSDSWVRGFVHDPEEKLRRCLPRCEEVTGRFRISSQIQSSAVDLYQTVVNPEPGIIWIGDAFQTVCPAAGLGVSKILTDVQVLADRIPQWLASPGMAQEKIAKFYSDPRKVWMDEHATARSHHNRLLITGQSLRWKIRRWLTHWRWKAMGKMNSFLSRRNQAGVSIPTPQEKVVIASRISESNQGPLPEIRNCPR